MSKMLQIYLFFYFIDASCLISTQLGVMTGDVHSIGSGSECGGTSRSTNPFGPISYVTKCPAEDMSLNLLIRAVKQVYYYHFQSFNCYYHFQSFVHIIMSFVKRLGHFPTMQHYLIFIVLQIFKIT